MIQMNVNKMINDCNIAYEALIRNFYHLKDVIVHALFIFLMTALNFYY